jgi:predicted nuclease of predicted toxin-antitoxin system
MFTFLIDECLSPLLAAAAQSHGHLGLHVNWVKLAGKTDRVISAHAISEDWIVVTNNGIDYRALYRAMEVHPGLIIILPSADREDQVRLFKAVLELIAGEQDMINKLIEINSDAEIIVSDFPPFRDNI